jgi:hypothetical protein
MGCLLHSSHPNQVPTCVTSLSQSSKR